MIDCIQEIDSAEKDCDENLVQIQPCHIFGVCKTVNNNLLFLDEETLIFSSGKHCIRYHTDKRGAEFIYGSKGRKVIQALALSPDRRYLAVSECDKSGYITILDLQNKKCCKTQVFDGCSIGAQEFVCLSFSANSKYLLAQAGGPKWNIYYLRWETMELICNVKTTVNGLISQVSFNPEDDNQICVTGKSVFKLFELKNDSLRLANSYQMENDEVLCHKWMSGDCIIAGTEAGKLLMLKSTHLQTNEKGARFFISSRGSTCYGHTPVFQWLCLFRCTGLVCLYEKTKDKENYRKTVEIRIPGDLPLQAIATMCISPKEETLVVTTDRGQMFHVNLTSIKDEESEEAQFEFLSHSYHTDNITGLSMCMMKSLIATCSTDCTVHIWNYKIKSLEQFKQFDKQPLSVSMYSNGLSILVVFSTKICLMNLLYNNIVTVKNFDINNCTECVLNHDCNMFAAVIKNMIHVYNIRTYKKLDLAGHSETVQSVKWSSDDSHLVSCGLDGAVYIWNILTGIYETKIETNCIYVDLTLFPNTGNILTVNQFTVQEFQDGKILHEITSDGVAYTAISITHSERAIFIGTAAGTIRIIELPFKNDKSWVEQQAHAVPITKLAVSPCDQFLFTASKDGTLLIWNIIDQGRIKLKIVTELDYTQEVLCTKEYMEEKLQTIDELTSQVKWLKMQHDCELDLMDVNYNKKMSNIVQNYLQEIKSLKAKIQMLNTGIEDERVSHQKLVTDLKEKHAQELNDLALDYNMRMTVENEVNCWAVHKAEELQQEHKEEQASLVLAIEDIKQALEHKLHELQANLDQEKKHSEESERRIKDDTESEITQLCLDYEKDIKLEREARLKTSNELEHLEQSISQYTKMKAVIEQQGLLVASAMAEKQMVMDKIRRAKLTIKELTEEMEKQSTTIDEQEHSINELHVKIKQNKQSMEQTEERLLSVTMESKLLEEGSMLKSKEERNEIERLQNEILERNQMYQGFADEVKHVNRKYSRIIDDLKQKLLSKNTALLEEKQKAKSLEAVVQRTKADIQNCTRFIQEPKKLKENVIELHSLHFHKEVSIGLEAEMKQKHVQTMEHFSKVFKCQKSRHYREIQNEKTTNARITNESTFMITQINEQELKNQELITSIRMKDIQEAETAAFSANQNSPGPCQNPTV